MGNTERTNVIVVGAGASAEFGLPTGETLKDKIKDISKIYTTDGVERFSDQLLADCFRHLKLNDSGYEYRREANTIGDSMANAPSIDNYLHTHGANEATNVVGKLLIARSIQIAEKNSTLFVNPVGNVDAIDFERGEQETENGSIIPSPKWSWLGQFFKLLVAEKRYEEFLESLKNVTFISFNYDRCIKQYLLYAARQYFRLSNDDIAEVDTAIEIIYPYGNIGELRIHEGSGRVFGAEPNVRELVEVSKGIRTFTEGIGNTALYDQITSAFNSCNVAIFLGFGYLPLNMRLLFQDQLFEVSNVYGTTLGMSEESSDIVTEELYESLVLGDPLEMQNERENQVKLSPVTCRDLFVKHHRFFLQ